jgi:hypothetical protein
MLRSDSHRGFRQGFAEVKDYYQLMNSNMRTFHSVKQETLHYTLNLGMEEIKATHLKIIGSVKDKSKQITLKICRMNQSFIVNNLALYDGVAKLCLSDSPQEYNENFSFSLFSNICHLSLADVHGIPKANFYLEKATKLEIWSCNFKEITAWNATKSGLKELEVSSCYSTEKLPPLGDIYSVSLEFIPSSLKLYSPQLILSMIAIRL